MPTPGAAGAPEVDAAPEEAALTPPPVVTEVEDEEEGLWRSFFHDDLSM